MTLTATQLVNLQKKFRTSHGTKMKKVANKTAIFYYEDEKNEPCIQVSFEDGKFDFDQIEKTLNLYNNVDNKVVATRSVDGSFYNVQKSISQMLDNVRTIDTAIFTKGFTKEFNKFTDDLRMVYATLNSI